MRRPLTIYRTWPDTGLVEVLYEVKGHGTQILSQKGLGDWIEVLGPLGKGFINNPFAERIILVSGGLGVASLMALAQEIVGKREESSSYIYSLIGAHTEEKLLGLEDFRALGDGVKVLPWVTRAGLETALQKLSDELQSEGVNLNSCALYACGPEAMLKRVEQWAKGFNMGCQVSLEAHMACGLGACQSCICKVKAQPEDTKTNSYTYKLVCKDGPVFDGGEIDWGE